MMSFSQNSRLTLLEALQVPELHQVVAIVIVGYIDLGIPGNRVLHPGPFVPPIAVMFLWQFYGGYGALTVWSLSYKKSVLLIYDGLRDTFTI